MIDFCSISFLAACAVAVLWGINENRTFFEKDIGWEIFDHFKPYHLFLVALILTVAVAGSNGNFRQFVFLTLWTPWTLDWVWWLIRKYHFSTMSFMEASKLYFGETNSWCEQSDWDNCPLPVIRLNPLRIEVWKPPLICGLYWWWIMLGVLLAAIALL